MRNELDTDSKDFHRYQPSFCLPTWGKQPWHSSQGKPVSEGEQILALIRCGGRVNWYNNVGGHSAISIKVSDVYAP